jgi:hypothetical protein
VLGLAVFLVAFIVILPYCRAKVELPTGSLGR